MDTVYNNKSTGPFMQTFKFIKYSVTLVVFHAGIEAIDMYKGILFLESILGEELLILK